MNKQFFFILFIILCKTSFAQVTTKIYTANGNGIDTRPNILLKLKNDGTYDMQIFNDNYFTWQFYNGSYSTKKDTLLLQYKQLNAEPVCRLIDTFHHQRVINFLYVDANEKVIDTFPVEFSGDTIMSDHFPLSYREKENDNIKGNIKFTWYVPDFKDREMYIKFYKPGRKTKDMFMISLIMQNDELFFTDENKYIFIPFDRLKLSNQ